MVSGDGIICHYHVPFFPIRSGNATSIAQRYATVCLEGIQHRQPVKVRLCPSTPTKVSKFRLYRQSFCICSQMFWYHLQITVIGWSFDIPLFIFFDNKKILNENYKCYQHSEKPLDDLFLLSSLEVECAREVLADLLFPFVLDP